jgi:hypothetical protein
VTTEHDAGAPKRLLGKDDVPVWPPVRYEVIALLKPSDPKKVRAGMVEGGARALNIGAQEGWRFVAFLPIPPGAYPDFVYALVQRQPPSQELIEARRAAEEARRAAEKAEHAERMATDPAYRYLMELIEEATGGELGQE